MKKILLTGFNAFGNLQINPSQVIVEEINRTKRDFKNIQLYTEILQTEFKASEEKIIKLIEEIKPDIVACLGVAITSNKFHLERVALNIDDTFEPDNIGYQPCGISIRQDGPTSYFSNLHLSDLCNALNTNGFPTVISNHAGTYVCNHIFYVVAHETNKLNPDCRCGFIHIPLPSEYITEKKPRIRLSYLELLNGIKFIIHHLSSNLNVS